MHSLTIWDEWAITSTPPREKTPHPDNIRPQDPSGELVEQCKEVRSRFVDKTVYVKPQPTVQFAFGDHEPLIRDSRLHIERKEVPYEEPDEPIDLEAILTRRWLRAKKLRWRDAFSNYREARWVSNSKAVRALFGEEQVGHPSLFPRGDIEEEEFDDVLTIASSMRDNEQSTDLACTVCGSQLLDEKASICSYCRQADLEDERVMHFESEGFEAISGHTDVARGSAGFDSVFTYEDEHEGGIRNLSEDEYFNRMERIEREAAIEDFQNAALELQPEDGDALKAYVEKLKQYMPNISVQ